MTGRVALPGCYGLHHTRHRTAGHQHMEMVRHEEQERHPPLPQRLPVHHAFTQALEDFRMTEVIVTPRHGTQRQEVDGIVFDPRWYVVRQFFRCGRSCGKDTLVRDASGRDASPRRPLALPSQRLRCGPCGAFGERALPCDGIGSLLWVVYLLQCRVCAAVEIIHRLGFVEGRQLHTAYV